MVGRASDDAHFSWRIDAAAVRLRVVMASPAILPRRLGASVGLDEVDRTFVVRIEELR